MSVASSSSRCEGWGEMRGEVRGRGPPAKGGGPRATRCSACTLGPAEHILEQLPHQNRENFLPVLSCIALHCLGHCGYFLMCPDGHLGSFQYSAATIFLAPASFCMDVRVRIRHVPRGGATGPRFVHSRASLPLPGGPAQGCAKSRSRSCESEPLAAAGLAFTKR